MNDFKNELLDAQRNFAEQSDVEWHKERIGKFTSSRLGNLMSKGRGKGALWGAMADTYIFEKIAEKLTGVPHFKTESRAMEWGIDHEDEAIDKYELATGNTVRRLAKVFIKFNDFAGGSPDGFIGEKKIIEVKCPYNSANHIRTVITRELNKEYMYQCQGNMLFSGRDDCDFISYDPRMPQELQISIIPVKRDDVICDAIADRIILAVERMNDLTKNYKVLNSIRSEISTINKDK